MGRGRTFQNEVSANTKTRRIGQERKCGFSLTRVGNVWKFLTYFIRWFLEARRTDQPRNLDFEILGEFVRTRQNDEHYGNSKRRERTKQGAQGESIPREQGNFRNSRQISRPAPALHSLSHLSLSLCLSPSLLIRAQPEIVIPFKEWRTNCSQFNRQSSPLECKSLSRSSNLM